jgi:hypothetical protein
LCNLYREKFFNILTISTAKYRTSLVKVNLKETVVRYPESSLKILFSYLFTFLFIHLKLKRKHNKIKNKIKKV